MELLSQLKDVYELETRIHTLTLRTLELTEAVKQAKFEARAANAELVEYNGFRALWDKASGRYAGKVYEMEHRIHRAEQILETVLREQRDTASELSSRQRQRKQLPSAQELKDAALKSPETAQQWARLECRLCGTQLLPLLKKNEQALMEYRQLLRGEFPVLSVEEQQQINAEPDIWAQQCSELLERMQEALKVLGRVLDIPPYFQSPIFFLMYAAARHNRMDRASQAHDQVLGMQKQVRELLAYYSD